MQKLQLKRKKEYQNEFDHARIDMGKPVLRRDAGQAGEVGVQEARVTLHVQGQGGDPTPPDG